MLKIPEIGFQKSKRVVNVNSNVSADWVEATVLFDDLELSRNDVVDLLLEEQICDGDNQDLAHQIADEAWQEVAKRRSWGGVPDTVTITANRIARAPGHWSEEPVRAFFLLLSMQRIFPTWANAWKAYVEAG